MPPHAPATLSASASAGAADDGAGAPLGGRRWGFSGRAGCAYNQPRAARRVRVFGRDAPDGRARSRAEACGRHRKSPATRCFVRAVVLRISRPRLLTGARRGDRRCTFPCASDVHDRARAHAHSHARAHAHTHTKTHAPSAGTGTCAEDGLCFLCCADERGSLLVRPPLPALAKLQGPHSVLHASERRFANVHTHAHAHADRPAAHCTHAARHVQERTDTRTRRQMHARTQEVHTHARTQEVHTHARTHTRK